jgi:naphthoate synthase
VVGEKRARELWFLCHRYDAATAERWGLVNKVVPGAELVAAAREWAREISLLSPTAIKFLKYAFNTDTAHQAGLSNVTSASLELFVRSPEGQEGATAFAEKRPPDFVRYAS